MIEIYLKTNTNYDKNGDITLEPTSCIYKDSEKEVIYQTALVNEIVYYGKQGEYDKALKLCEDNEEYLPLLKRYKNSINYLKGDIDKIEVNDMYEGIDDIDNDLDIPPFLRDRDNY